MRDPVSASSDRPSRHARKPDVPEAARSEAVGRLGAKREQCTAGKGRARAETPPEGGAGGGGLTASPTREPPGNVAATLRGWQKLRWRRRRDASPCDSPGCAARSRPARHDGASHPCAPPVRPTAPGQAIPHPAVGAAARITRPSCRRRRTAPPRRPGRGCRCGSRPPAPRRRRRR